MPTYSPKGAWVGAAPSGEIQFYELKFGRGLKADDVLGLKALGALLNFEFHRLAFVERLVALGLDRREMHEDVFAGLALDETKTLGRVEPLDCTLLSGHCCDS